MERVEASIERADQGVEAALAPLADALRPVYARRNVEFPDRRLVQFDCGKLQELADLLRELYSGGHRCLIFTQMTRMLDVLEEFLTLHGWVYVRLDGTTKLTERQALIERFNRDNRLFVFILSTRSGGFGLNLTGADTVIFYDSDWNPAMDAQAQDRCHRIGQTRDVHIYRLITRHTIEENILKKANQKRELDDLVIQGGQFTTEFFRDLDPRNLVSEDARRRRTAAAVAVAPRGRRGKVRAVAAPEAARRRSPPRRRARARPSGRRRWRRPRTTPTPSRCVTRAASCAPTRPSTSTRRRRAARRRPRWRWRRRAVWPTRRIWTRRPTR
jgi:superfamily II DNA or RNA helicase